MFRCYSMLLNIERQLHAGMQARETFEGKTFKQFNVRTAVMKVCGQTLFATCIPVFSDTKVCLRTNGKNIVLVLLQSAMSYATDSSYMQTTVH